MRESRNALQWKDNYRLESFLFYFIFLGGAIEKVWCNEMMLTKSSSKYWIKVLGKLKWSFNQFLVCLSAGMHTSVREINLCSDTYFLRVDWEGCNFSTGFQLLLTDGQDAWRGEGKNKNHSAWLHSLLPYIIHSYLFYITCHFYTQSSVFRGSR